MSKLRTKLIASVAALAMLAPSLASAQQALTNPTFIGHTKSAPEGASPVLTSCGTGPTIQAGSSDAAGRFVNGSGATTCTLTFQRTYTQPPICVVSAEVATQPTWTVSATAITFATTIASTAYHYQCQAVGSGS